MYCQYKFTIFVIRYCIYLSKQVLSFQEYSLNYNFNTLIKSGLLTIKDIECEVRMEYPAIFSWYHPKSINHVSGAIWVSKQNIQKNSYFSVLLSSDYKLILI